VAQIEKLLLPTRDLIAEAEKLLVLLVERLAQVEILAARDATRAVAGARPRLQLVELALQPLHLRRLASFLLDLVLEARLLGSDRREILLQPASLRLHAIELRTKALELQRIRRRPRRDRAQTRR